MSPCMDGREGFDRVHHRRIEEILERVMLDPATEQRWRDEYITECERHAKETWGHLDGEFWDKVRSMS